MIEQVSWDQSVLKKYSYSNHYKLLNQLRNEVKKYPLNKKRNIKLNGNNENKNEVNNNFSRSISHELNTSDIGSINKEINNNKSHVSFNNSKNFSIYNNSKSDSTYGKKDTKLLSKNNEIENLSPSTFNDRLNQVDMK